MKALFYALLGATAGAAIVYLAFRFVHIPILPCCAVYAAMYISARGLRTHPAPAVISIGGVALFGVLCYGVSIYFSIVSYPAYLTVVGILLEAATVLAFLAAAGLNIFLVLQESRRIRAQAAACFCAPAAGEAVGGPSSQAAAPEPAKDEAADAKPNRKALYVLAGLCCLLLVFVTALWIENETLRQDNLSLSGRVDALYAKSGWLEDEISTLTSQNADLQDLASALKDRLRVVQGEADRSRAELHALRYGPQ